MFKKYLIRIIGALCILGSLALIFMTSMLEIDGVKTKDWRKFSEDTEKVCKTVEDDFLTNLEHSELFEDELDDCDLPHTRSKLKSLFKEVYAVTDTITAKEYALKDVLVLSWKAPKLIDSIEGITDSRMVSNVFFVSIASHVVYEQSKAGIIDCSPYDSEVIANTAEMYMDTSEDTIEMISELSPVFLALTAALVFFVILGLVSAIAHMFNKGRWVKYLFLVLLICLVVGFTIAAPLVSEMITDSMMNTSNLKDLVLQMTFTPYLAVALAIVPVVLDIIFERKNKKMEE